MVFRTNFDQMPSLLAPVKPKAKDNPIVAATSSQQPSIPRGGDSKRASLSHGANNQASQRQQSTSMRSVSSSPLRPTATAVGQSDGGGVGGGGGGGSSVSSMAPLDPPYHPGVAYPYDCNYQHSHHHPTVGGTSHAYEAPLPPHSQHQHEHHGHHDDRDNKWTNEVAESDVSSSLPSRVRPLTAPSSAVSSSGGGVLRMSRSEQASHAGSTRLHNKQNVSATARIATSKSTSMGSNYNGATGSAAAAKGVVGVGVGQGSTLGVSGEGHGEAYQAVSVSDHIRRLPEELSTTLAHIVGQLDVMAKSMMALEMRMRLQETNVARIQQQLMGLYFSFLFSLLLVPAPSTSLFLLLA
jgi:hypothetical protein